MFLLVGMLLAPVPGHEGFHVELPLAAFVVHEPEEVKHFRDLSILGDGTD